MAWKAARLTVTSAFSALCADQVLVIMCYVVFPADVFPSDVCVSIRFLCYPHSCNFYFAPCNSLLAE
jgi:hypothetical protein